MPGVFPQWRRILVGHDGTIWMESWQQTAGGIAWRMLDTRGSPVADVTVAANFRVTVAERDMLWGIEQNDNGMESIVRMRLVNGPM